MNRGMGGYTLMEMMVIVVVVSILAGITFVGGERFLSRTRDERQRANVSVLSLKLERYYKYHSDNHIGHEYPSCKDLLKNFKSIIGDDSLKEELVKCNRSDWAGGNKGELLYETSNIDNGDCTKPTHGVPADIVAATCVKYSIIYKERSTGIEKKVDSIWRD
jgi:hypothetical protein